MKFHYAAHAGCDAHGSLEHWLHPGLGREDAREGQELRLTFPLLFSILTAGNVPLPHERAMPLERFFDASIHTHCRTRRGLQVGDALAFMNALIQVMYSRSID